MLYLKTYFNLSQLQINLDQKGRSFYMASCILCEIWEKLHVYVRIIVTRDGACNVALCVQVRPGKVAAPPNVTMLTISGCPSSCSCRLPCSHRHTQLGVTGREVCYVDH